MLYVLSVESNNYEYRYILLIESTTGTDNMTTTCTTNTFHPLTLTKYKLQKGSVPSAERILSGVLFRSILRQNPRNRWNIAEFPEFGTFQGYTNT